MSTLNAGRQLIKAALESGFTVAVHYEQDHEPAMTRKGTEHLTALWSEATACDEATVYFYEASRLGGGTSWRDFEKRGWAYLVHWNEGDEVISDHGSKGWVNDWAVATEYGQRKVCIDRGLDGLVFEGSNEYEPDPITGDPRCFQCDLKANPDRYGEQS